MSERFNGNERRYVSAVLDSEFRGSKATNFVDRLESLFAEKIGAKYAIAFSNGTATMHAALEALEVGLGSEVIVPPLTMSSTSFAVLHANATPVFADIDRDTFQIAASKIEKNLSSATKAVVPVSLYGLMPDMAAISRLATEHALSVVEDNAEAVGATQDGRHCGTSSDFGSFSFQSSKHLTSGEGGILTTNSDRLAEKARLVQCLGYSTLGAKKGKIPKEQIQDPQFSRHRSLGWNYRMPELCAAVALAQVERLEELVEKRVTAAHILLEAIGSCQWLRPQVTPMDRINSYWTLAVVLDHPRVSWQEFRNCFVLNGGDGIYAAWRPAYLEPAFQKRSLLGREKFIATETLEGYRVGLCPIAEDLAPRMLQFRTNYWDKDAASMQAQRLVATIEQLNKRA